MQRNTLLLLFLLSGLYSLRAQTVNWANDIAPILYENCTKCHREAGLGHFSLVGYGNAFSKRLSIREETGARRMPPWKPDPTYRQYAHENRLSDAEIQLIDDWVEAGAPSGDLSQAPPDPVFTQGSSIGEPDHFLTTPFYTVTATDDEYRCFVIPNGLNQVSYLRGLEAIPGNHEVVHHILIYEDVTGQAQILDNQTPNEHGYVNFGSSGVAGARLVGAWVPGAQSTLLPPFMGIKLTPGADLIVQMHYPKGVTGMSDMTTLNFFFTPGNQNIREVSLAPFINHFPFSLQNGPLFIPANTTRTFHAKFTAPQKGSLISVAPHMHLIGRNITSFGVTPQGDTIPFIRINDWDFHWQGGYTFQHVQPIPSGTVLHAYATYDNTSDNPHQPSDPPQDVSSGEATTDEMMIIYFAYMSYQTGDENILLDSTLLSTSTSPFIENEVIGKVVLFPNPVQNWLDVQFDLAEKTGVRIHIVDHSGRIIQFGNEQPELAPGTHRQKIDVSTLPPGVYFVEIQSAHAGKAAGKFVKP